MLQNYQFYMYISASVMHKVNWEVSQKVENNKNFSLYIDGT
jgi:hypothetical protein